jgi:hypothetical protein
MVAVIPFQIGKAMMVKNTDEVNHGYARKLKYLGYISMPTVTFLLFPLLMLAFNHKVRRSFIRELKETPIWKRMTERF